MFFGPINKTRWPPRLLIGWDIFDFSCESADWNSTKLDRKQLSKISISSTKFVFFRLIGKTRWPPRPLFQLLWNNWIEFNETWQEARSQCLLPSLCFSGRSEKQDGCPGTWFNETFSTSPLIPLEGIQRNLTGSKISMSPTKFMFFEPIRKTRWLPWPLINWDIFISPLKLLKGIQQNLIGSKISTSPTKVVFFWANQKKRWPPQLLIGWDIFDFSCESAEWNSTKLDRRQDLNFLYQVFVFWLIGKTRLPPWLICQIDGTLYSAMSGARYVALWAPCFKLQRWLFSSQLWWRKRLWQFTLMYNNLQLLWFQRPRPGDHTCVCILRFVCR